MIEGVPESLQRLTEGGQFLIGVGLLVMVLTLLAGGAGKRGSSNAGVLGGGTLVAMGVVALYAGRAAGGEADYQVGAVPMSLLVLVTLLLLGLLVTRMAFAPSGGRSESRSDRAPTAETYVVYALVTMAFALPVGVFAWRTLMPPAVGPVDAEEKVARLRPLVSRHVRESATQALSKDLKVTLAEGVTAAEVVLKCRMRIVRAPFEAGVALFSPMPDGDCLLYLPGTERPFDQARRGDELACRVDGRSTVCEGGWVHENLGSITVHADRPGTVRVGGGSKLPLPVERLEVRPERHRVVVELDGGVGGDWSLTVGPREDVTLVFGASPAVAAVAAPAAVSAPSPLMAPTPEAVAQPAAAPAAAEALAVEAEAAP
jgi:hypothetical protein